MKSLILLLLPALMVTQGCTEDPAAPTSTLVAYVSMMNGVFFEGKPMTCDRLQQADYGNGIIVRLRPWDVPVLYPSWGLYYNVEVNGRLMGEEILAVREEDDGSIHVTPYSLRNKPPSTQGETDMSYLMNMTLDDLRRRDDCEGVLTQEEPNLFKGRWPRCRAQVQDNTPTYDSILKCNAWILKGLVPSHNFKRVASCGRFPLLPYMLD